MRIEQISEGVFRVLSTNGNTRLGGDDIDAAFVACLAERTGVSAGNASFASRLREVATEAKHRLSSAEDIVIDLPFVGWRRYCLFVF